MGNAIASSNSLTRNDNCSEVAIGRIDYVLSGNGDIATPITTVEPAKLSTMAWSRRQVEDQKKHGDNEKHSQGPVEPFLFRLVHPVVNDCGKQEGLRHNFHVSAILTRDPGEDHSLQRAWRRTESTKNSEGHQQPSYSEPTVLFAEDEFAQRVEGEPKEGAANRLKQHACS